jgi:hypothetical protein
MTRGWVLVPAERRWARSCRPYGTRFHSRRSTPDLRPGLMNVVADATGSVAAGQAFMPAEAVMGILLRELLRFGFE